MSIHNSWYESFTKAIVQQNPIKTFLAIDINQAVLLSYTSCLWTSDTTYFYIPDVASWHFALTLLMDFLSTNLLQHLQSVCFSIHDSILSHTIYCLRKSVQSLPLLLGYKTPYSIACHRAYRQTLKGL